VQTLRVKSDVLAYSNLFDFFDDKQVHPQGFRCQMMLNVKLQRVFVLIKLLFKRHYKGGCHAI
jgi:hypothetical protein